MIISLRTMLASLGIALSLLMAGIVPALQAQGHATAHQAINITTPAVERANNDNVVVYTTKTGECYHRASCSCLRKSCYKTTVKKVKSRWISTLQAL